MGLEVLIASQGENSLITEVHQGIHIDLNDFSGALTTIVAAAKNQPFDGILGCDDSTVELAAAAAEKLGLAHNPPVAARLSRRKDLARAHLALSDCPIPIHCLVDCSIELKPQMKGIPYPCVIKPLNMSASRGVIRADNETEFLTACDRIKRIITESDLKDKREQTHLLIEEYIDGIEIALEAYLEQGELKVLAIFDKPDPLTGPFFAETIYVTPSTLDQSLQDKISEVVHDACKAYGLTTGPVHAELRIDNNNQPWILEVAARTIGGDCARTLDTGDGLNLEALTISLAMGEAIPEIVERKLSHGVMMLPITEAGLLKRTEGISEAKKIKHIDNIEIVIPNGHELIPLPEGNQYLGYIFASAKNNTEVIDAIRQAYDCLNFVVAPLFKINKA